MRTPTGKCLKKKKRTGLILMTCLCSFSVLPKHPGLPFAYPLSTSAIQLKWQLIKLKKSANLQLSHHLIQYRLDDATSIWENKTTEDLSAPKKLVSNMTVTGLDRNQRYLFRVIPVFTYEGNRIQGTPSPIVGGKTNCLGKHSSQYNKVIQTIFSVHPFFPSPLFHKLQGV